MFKEMRRDLAIIKDDMRIFKEYVKATSQGMQGVSITKFLPDSPTGRTQVSFSLLNRDWCQLKNSSEWENFHKALLEAQNISTQQSHQE